MLKFLTRFAYRDLTDTQARRTTGVLFGTILVVCALTLGLFGFIEGVRRVNLERLRKEDGLALCLWLGDTLVTGRITPEVAAELEQKVADSLHDRDHLGGVFPFSKVPLSCITRDQKHETLLIGRTIRLGEKSDPLFQSRALVTGRPLTGPADEGIVLTPTGLLQLGYTAADPPTAVRMRTNAGAEVPVPVLGVIAKDLPTPHSFLVAEAYERQLRAENPDPVLPSIKTVPLPAGWPTSKGELPEDIHDMLNSPEWEIGLWTVEERFDLDRGADVPVLYARSARVKEEAPYLSDWNRRLARLREQMAKHYPTPNGFRLAVDEGTLRREVPPPRVNHDMVAVYIREDPEGLIPAADASETVRAGRRYLSVNRTVVDQVVSISQKTRQLLQVVGLLEAFLVLIAVGNLYVIQAMRAEQRTAEIGMLKAMGMTRRDLRRLDLLEALLLWLPAAAGGVALGLAGELGVAAWWYGWNTDEMWRGWYWSWPLILGVLGGSCVVCVGCGWLSTRRARRNAPAVSLRMRN